MSVRYRELPGIMPTAGCRGAARRATTSFFSFPQTVSTISGKNRRIRATEAPFQSVRYSIQLIVRHPFERPAEPLRRMSDERSACNV
jgi:hypothetical protein